MENKEVQAIEEQPEGLEDALEIMERRQLLFQRVMEVAIRATSQGDWVDQNGKPYLQVSGSEKVARRFGVRISDVEIERENITDDAGIYYLYTVTGKAALGNGNESIEAIGTCSSRDKFFGRAHGEQKLMQDVDIGNIKRKAYTNFMGNAITRLLGIRNLSWEDIAKFGINKNGKASVAYKSTEQKASETKVADKAATTASTSKKPFWPHDFNGKTYLSAVVGDHFSEEFLVNLGMKQTKKPGLFSCLHTADIENALNDEMLAAEDVLAQAKKDGE
jgi:hypothetical protein